MPPLRTALVERNTWSVANRRRWEEEATSTLTLKSPCRQDVAAFLEGVAAHCPSAAASPLFYTFFHSILRDEGGDTAQHRVPAFTAPLPGAPVASVKGELCLRLELRGEAGGRATLALLVKHARSLANAPGSSPATPLPPDAYVKCYLRGQHSIGP